MIQKQITCFFYIKPGYHEIKMKNFTKVTYVHKTEVCMYLFPRPTSVLTL